MEDDSHQSLRDQAEKKCSWGSINGFYVIWAYYLRNVKVENPTIGASKVTEFYYVKQCTNMTF